MISLNFADGPTTVVLISGTAGMKGHGSRYVGELAVGLARRHADVHVVVPSNTSRLEDWATDPRITLHPVSVDFARLDAERYQGWGPLAGAARGSARLALGLGAYRRVLREALPRVENASSGPYVVHVLDSEYVSLVWLLRRLRRRPRALAFATIHPSDFGPFRATLAGLYKGALRGVLSSHLRRVSGVVCHGRWIAERLVEQLHLHPDRVHPFSYPSEARDRRVDKNDARAKLGVPRDAPTTLWFGMIRRNKRLDLALDAFAHLPTDHHLIVAGHPADTEARTIQDRIDRLGLRGRVHPTLRYVSESEIATFFSAADVLLATHVPSFTSASGPVGDARTYRLPVVTSRSGQLRTYVEAFDTGIVTEDDSPQAFAHALHAAHDRVADPRRGPAWERTIGDAAEALSWDAFAEAHATWYAGARRDAMNESLP